MSAYDRRTVEKISDYAAQSQADVLVTTEKDGVKLAGLLFDKPLWQLTVRIDLVAGHFELQNRLTDLAAAARRGDHGEPEEADA